LLVTLEDWAGRVRYLVPSTDPSSPRFEPQGYWRGPVWAVVNYLIVVGFSEYGYSEMASRIRRDTPKLSETAGFSEYFHPLTMQGLGGGVFCWTAAVTWLGGSIQPRVSI